MVDIDKQACQALAEKGYHYLTWDFLEKYPKSMEPRYLHLNWDHIPRMYLRKYFLHTSVIQKKEWARLSEPASLTQYWEPSQVPDDFHWTFALALCRTAFHDCNDNGRQSELVVLVAIVRKPAQVQALPFATAVKEFSHDVDDSPTLILVRLHRCSRLFPDVYYDWYQQQVTVMHDSGQPFNMGHPQRFVGALLHNAHAAGEKPSPKAKLPPAFLDHGSKFSIDSCVQEYRDWATGDKDQSSPDEHFVWLSNGFTPFWSDLGPLFLPPDFTMGLPTGDSWPKRARKVPWVLDPAEHPRLAMQSHQESASPSSGDEK